MQTNKQPLADQSYTISPTLTFTYQLSAEVNPYCGSIPITWTGWALTATSVDNPSSVSFFETISDTGEFIVLPFDDVLAAGVYTITVTSIKLSGYAFSGAILGNGTFPNFF